MADHGPVEIVRVRIADSRTFAISRQGHKGASGKVSLATFRRVKELIMKLKFCGHLVSLKEQVKACRVRGEWRDIEKNSLYQLVASAEVVEIWCPRGCRARWPSDRRSRVELRSFHADHEEVR